MLERLSQHLTATYMRGFSVRDLRNIRAFYLAYKSREIRQTPSAESQFLLPWSRLDFRSIEKCEEIP